MKIRDKLTLMRKSASENERRIKERVSERHWNARIVSVFSKGIHLTAAAGRKFARISKRNELFGRQGRAIHCSTETTGNLLRAEAGILCHQTLTALWALESQNPSRMKSWLRRRPHCRDCSPPANKKILRNLLTFCVHHNIINVYTESEVIACRRVQADRKQRIRRMSSWKSGQTSKRGKTSIFAAKSWIKREVTLSGSASRRSKLRLRNKRERPPLPPRSRGHSITRGFPTG